MKKNRFYPEVIVKLLETPTNNRVSVLFDDNQIGEIVFLKKDGSEPSNDEIEKYFDMKSELYIKDNSIRKYKEEIQNNEEIMGQISQSIIAKDPSITSNLTKMMNEVNKEVEERAKKIIKDNSTIKEDSIIKLGGITREENGKLVLDSKTIIYDNDKPSISGIYMYAVNSKKVPLIIRKKNGYNRILLDSILISKNQIDTYFSHAIDTVQAYIDGKINNLPKPFIMFKDMSERSNIEKRVKDVINIINNRESSGEDVLKALSDLKEYIDNYEESNFIEKLDIFIPIVDNNIDFDQIKAATLTKMLNTSLSYLKKDHSQEFLREIAEECFNDIIEKEEIEVHSSYSPPKSNCGFFPESLHQNFIVTSKVYDYILMRINEIAKNPENIKKKDNEEIGIN